MILVAAAAAAAVYVLALWLHVCSYLGRGSRRLRALDLLTGVHRWDHLPCRSRHLHLPLHCCCKIPVLVALDLVNQEMTLKQKDHR